MGARGRYPLRGRKSAPPLHAFCCEGWKHWYKTTSAVGGLYSTGASLQLLIFILSHYLRGKRYTIDRGMIHACGLCKVKTESFF